MKRLVLLTVVALALFIWSCSETTQTEKNLATLQGKVFTVDQGNRVVPVEDALVTVKEFYAQSRTNSQGSYQLTLDLTGETEDQTQVTIEASKGGYEAAEATVLAVKGEVVAVPDLTLLQIVTDSTGKDTSGTVPDTTRTSGKAAHIEVYGDHPQHIYVLGTGLQETAEITFVVKDANGVPVDRNHRVRVEFKILAGPNGGEYLSADTMTTRNGLVTTVLNSGIVAGPVQLQASAQVDGSLIWSTPVRISIYGGLPDASHFSLAANQVNIAGLLYHGLIDNITAFVGDKYGNPVAPGTVVYFYSDYGITDGSATTDEMGRATVRFMTADPLPPNPQDSAFVHVYGWTYSDTVLSKSIVKSTRILLSDATAPIVVTPSSFTYDNTNTPVNFNYAIQDIWGRPLVADSRITVSATDGDVYGDTDIVLEDTQLSGPGTTQFSFTWTPGDSLEAPQVYITIKVQTPENGNGYRSVHVLGTKQ